MTPKEQFNAAFTAGRYEQLKADLTQENGPTEIRLLEMPIVLPKTVVNEIVSSSRELIDQAMQPELLEKMAEIVPPVFKVANPKSHPDFIIVDFALTQDGGELRPKLIEMQAVPSLFGFVASAAEAHKKTYGLGDQFRFAVSAGTREDYDDNLRKIIVGGRDPKNVVLMEIDPWNQKTKPDFVALQNMLGIQVKDVMDVYKKDDKLYYRDDAGEEVRVERLYSRVASDEYFALGLEDKMSFKFSDKLDVEIVSDPTWQYLMSKPILAHLNHPNAPKARLLTADIPQDLENYVLKPLFGKGGQGVIVNVTQKDIDAVPMDERKDFILMEKAVFAPVVETPAGPRKTEVRIMYTWGEEGPKPTILMARVMQGDLANVGFSKDSTWVGLAPVLWDEQNKVTNVQPRV